MSWQWSWFLFPGHFYVHRRCAIWSDKVKIKTIKSEDDSSSSSSSKKNKETETYVGVDQVRWFTISQNINL